MSATDGKACTRCGGAETIAHGERECVARAGGTEAVATWPVAVCHRCGLQDVVDDRRSTVRMAPVKGLVLSVLGLGLTGVALISLTEPGLGKAWAIPFGFLGIPAALEGLGRLFSIPTAIKQLDATAANLEAGRLTDSDGDLLIHLEAHRILDALKYRAPEVYGGLILPAVEGADVKSTIYTLRRLDAPAGASSLPTRTTNPGVD